ncbi:MAG: glutamine-hydrolyzing GMP synthase, partial [Spirochaetia bacterium]|nr:glutamine-hydrolyzing GMP synthase [Spirochaetia bacterium]
MIPHEQLIVVLDFGAQYSQLIARRVRETKVYSKIVPFTIPAEEIRKLHPKGIIFSGGPASVTSQGSPRPDPEIFTLGIPILGICYGLQVITVMKGGTVTRPDKREYGCAQLSMRKKSSLLEGFHENSQVWMSHGDSVKTIPEGFTVTADTENCSAAVVENSRDNLYGVQFHPEVIHTEQGNQLIRNFVHSICGSTSDWDMGSFVDQAVQDIKKQVGDKTVLCGLSGGVDSSVAAALIHKAIGDQLVCVFVNNGLLRRGEADLVLKVFRDNFHIRLRYSEAEELFLDALRGVSEPEQKRKIIGKVFIDVFEREARAVGEVDFLAQGTLYPDVIESTSATGGPSATIKSHHNVGGLPDDLRFELIEPLKELFKDEVRLLGKELGLPDVI